MPNSVRIVGFDPAALEAIKASLDAAPGAATDWRRALEYGQGVNAAIRASADVSRDR